MPRRLFRSPRPPFAFVLTRNRLVFVGKQKRSGRSVSPGAPEPLALASRPLPPGYFRPGPGGVPLPGEGLTELVTSLVSATQLKVGAASLAVPDDFVRILTVDLEEAGDGKKEVEDVLLWKFGKLFGEPAPPLRMVWQSVGKTGGLERVVALATLEETAATLEAAFARAGVRLGAIESAALCVASLARKAIPPDGFVVWADGDTATTVFLRSGKLRFVRTKETSDPEEALQEIRLAASFVAADFPTSGSGPLDVEGPCAAGPVGSPIVQAFQKFREEAGGSFPARISRAALAPSLLPLSGLPTTSATLAGAEDPALLVALGAMAKED